MAVMMTSLSSAITNLTHTPLLIFIHDVIILTQNEAIGARPTPTPLAVAAPMASFFLLEL